MGSRRKRARVCGFHFYGWCDWCKVRCHYQGDDYPPKKLPDTGPCPWASKFAEKNFCPTPADAQELGAKYRVLSPAFPHSVHLVSNRICLSCEKPVRPLRDREGFERYQVSGLCQKCQDDTELVELTEEDFE